MTPTDELRRMLDERGTHYKAWDGGPHPMTVWHDESFVYEYTEYTLNNGCKQISNCPADNDGHCILVMTHYHCTPTQAIAATVGVGTLLIAENTQLRAENAKMRDTCINHYETNCLLREENAKLRELVDAWMGCGTRYHTMEGACPMFDKDAKDFCKAYEIARELGFEVDE